MADDELDDLALGAVGDAAELNEALSDLELAEKEEAGFLAESAVELYTSDLVARPGYRVHRTLPVVTARRVEGMHLFRDLAMALRDTFGGRSNTAEEAFAKLEAEVLRELKEKAHHAGADAAIRLRLQFGEISGGGKSQLFYVTAQATPVTLVEGQE